MFLKAKEHRCFGRIQTTRQTVTKKLSHREQRTALRAALRLPPQ